MYITYTIYVYIIYMLSCSADAAAAAAAAGAGSERGSELPAARQGAGVDLDDGTHTPLHSSNGCSL